MKNFLITTASLFALTASATFAADLPSNSTVPTSPAVNSSMQATSPAIPGDGHTPPVIDTDPNAAVAAGKNPTEDLMTAPSATVPSNAENK